MSVRLDMHDTSEEVLATAPQGETAVETTPPERAPLPAEEFAALGLGAAALHAIADLGYGSPTPIQAQTIGRLLAGHDVIAQAPTGTGKTAAYGLPIVEQLDENMLKPQALVILPTRELAIQVSEALHALGRYREMVTLPIYGGQPYERQLRALARGVQVVVGTPGRLLDHLGRGTLDLSGVRVVVLDEADEMLNMGFIEDIEALLAALPEQHQSALFSATIPPRIARLAEQYLHEAEHVSISTRDAIAPRVRQVYYEVAGHAKPEALSRILDLEEPDSAIVFVRTRRDADAVAEDLSRLGYLAQAIHGEINQAQRERVLDRFRAGHTQLLVATDVAARGLDIPDVSHIINYDLPVDAESYVHRIGRTGRAGRGGEALTLVTPRERRQLQYIEQAIHRRLERLRLPTPADIAARRRSAFRQDVLKILDDGSLDPFLALVEDLAGTHDAAALAAAAFKMAAQARESHRPGRAESWVGTSTTSSWQEPARGLAPSGFAPNGAGGHERVDEAQEPGGQRARPGRTYEGAGDQGRPPRGRRERHPEVEGGAGQMARLFLRVGRRNGVRPADLVGAIANEAGLPGDAIGDIDIYDAFAFVEVPEESADSVRDALNRTTIRGNAPRATLARPQDEWNANDDDFRDMAREDDHARRRPTAHGPGGREPGQFGGRDRADSDERRPSLRVPSYAARRGAGRAPGGRPGRDDRRPGPRRPGR